MNAVKSCNKSSQNPKASIKPNSQQQHIFTSVSSVKAKYLQWMGKGTYIFHAWCYIICVYWNFYALVLNLAKHTELCGPQFFTKIEIHFTRLRDSHSFLLPIHSGKFHLKNIENRSWIDRTLKNAVWGMTQIFFSVCTRSRYTNPAVAKDRYLKMYSHIFLAHSL